MLLSQIIEVGKGKREEKQFTSFATKAAKCSCKPHERGTLNEYEAGKENVCRVFQVVKK